MEIWKYIDGYSGRYKISSNGRVLSYCRSKERILKQSETKFGYKFVRLSSGKGKMENHFVHRLVAKAFIENPLNKTQVNHKDGDKSNNTVSNLEWATPSENVIHSIDVLGKKPAMLGKFGSKNKNSIPVCQYDLNGFFVKQWAGVSDASRAIGCNPCQILNVISGRIVTCHGFIWSYKKADRIDNSRVRDKKTHKDF